MPHELSRAFSSGIAFDASAVAGFGDELRSDLFLRPEPETLIPLPWRPEHGRVVQMFSSITWPDGSLFPADTRGLLKKALSDAKKAGFRFTFGAEQEFNLFRTDEAGKATKNPCDEAGYMDVAPEDSGENIRREICLTLEQMGIHPESSRHEEGPGQNEIDFRYSDPLSAADQAVMFRRVVRTVAGRNGLSADFSPKPLPDAPGSGFHINMSLQPFPDRKTFSHIIAGILENIRAMTLFLNPSEASYRRLGSHKAPRYISWSEENRSQLIRIPAAEGEYRRLELRSPDPAANPHLAFALLIYAALSGIQKELSLCPPSNVNLYRADPEILSRMETLPGSLKEAVAVAEGSSFIRSCLPEEILSAYLNL